MALITSARLIWSCACRSHADGSACPDTDCGSHADFGGGGEPAMEPMDNGGTDDYWGPSTTATGGGGEPAMEPMDNGGTSPCDCGGGTTGFRRLQGGGGECDCAGIYDGTTDMSQAEQDAAMGLPPQGGPPMDTTGGGTTGGGGNECPGLYMTPCTTRAGEAGCLATGICSSMAEVDSWPTSWYTPVSGGR